MKFLSLWDLVGLFFSASLNLALAMWLHLDSKMWAEVIDVCNFHEEALRAVV